MGCHKYLEKEIAILNNKPKKVAEVLQKDSLSYVECDQNGFPIKTWEDPHVGYNNKYRHNLRKSNTKVIHERAKEGKDLVQ